MITSLGEERTTCIIRDTSSKGGPSWKLIVEKLTYQYKTTTQRTYKLPTFVPKCPVNRYRPRSRASKRDGGLTWERSRAYPANPPSPI